MKIQELWHEKKIFMHINKLPQMCNQKIDIYNLFISVTNLGGSENCDKMNLWEKILVLLKFPSTRQREVMHIKKKYEEFGLIFMEKSLLCPKSTELNTAAELNCNSSIESSNEICTESKLKYILPYIIF